MLILSRNIGEAIMIGDDVKVFVLGVRGGQVRIGVEAPKHVAVHRSEIYNKIQAGEQKLTATVVSKKSKLTLVKGTVAPVV